MEKGFLMTWSKLLSVLFFVAPLMLLVGCDGGGQPLDTPTLGGEVIAKVEAEPSPAEEPSKPELTETPHRLFSILTALRTFELSRALIQ